MSSAEGPASRQVVTALRRPPVRQSTVVRAGARHTFDTFVTTIGAWWPVQPFSAGKDRVRDVTVEQRQGGRVYETWDDRTEIDWGTVTEWEPPERFTMTWTGTPAAASWSHGGYPTGSRSGSNSACCRHHPNDRPVPATRGTRGRPGNDARQVRWPTPAMPPCQR